MTPQSAQPNTMHTTVRQQGEKCKNGDRDKHKQTNCITQKNVPILQCAQRAPFIQDPYTSH